MKSFPGESVIFLTIISMGWSQQEEVVIGQEGQSVTLSRPEKGDVVWKFGKSQDNINHVVLTVKQGRQAYGEIMKGRSSLLRNTVSLTINSLQKNDFGYYSSEVAGTKIFYRLYRATVIATPSLLVLASQELVLDCVVEDFHQDLSYEWLSPGRKLQTWEKTQKISNVTLNDKGDWVCAVIHKQYRADIKFSLNVVDLITFRSLYTTTGSRLHVSCNISSSLELSSISALGLTGGSWTFTPLSGDKTSRKLVSFSSEHRWKVLSNDLNLTWTSETLRNSLSFIIKSVQEANVGSYCCELRFNNGITLRKEVKVNVLRVLISPDPPIYLGQDVNLTCSLVHSKISSDLTIKWKVPAKSAVNSVLKKSHPALLPIPWATEKDRGKWTCQLQSDNTVLISADLMLKIDKVPVDVKLWASVCGAVVVFILVLIIILKLVQQLKLRVHFRSRRHKTKYCCCKNPQPKGFYKT